MLESVEKTIALNQHDRGKGKRKSANLGGGRVADQRGKDPYRRACHAHRAGDGKANDGRYTSGGSLEPIGPFPGSDRGDAGRL